jgi:hypothetical protein
LTRVLDIILAVCHRAAAAENLDAKVSKWNAMDRLMRLGKYLENDQEMKSAVFELVKGIIDDGHAKLVDNPDVPPGTPSFYLPIHVDKKKYPKYRICQDGAAKVRGRSLKDKLLAGPDLLNSLVGCYKSLDRTQLR